MIKWLYLAEKMITEQIATRLAARAANISQILKANGAESNASTLRRSGSHGTFDIEDELTR